MSDNVYAISHIAGSSSNSLEDAIQRAIKTAARRLKNLDWFEVSEIRGHIADGAVGHYQVVLKVGFRYEEQ